MKPSVSRAMTREFTASMRKKLAKMAKNIKTIKKDLVCKMIVSRFSKCETDAGADMNAIAHEQSALRQYQKEYREYNAAYCILCDIAVDVFERNTKHPLNMENVNKIVDSYKTTMHSRPKKLCSGCCSNCH